MATADEVRALIRTHGDGDDTAFYAVALQVAAHAARHGQRHLATELKDLVEGLRLQGHGQPGPVGVAAPRAELAGLLSTTQPTARLADLSLEPGTRAELDRILLEQRQQHRLRDRGFGPVRRLLLIGPPGTGKTFSAAALAGELHLPLFTLRLDGLITRSMGEAVANLRLVFEAVGTTRGVYL